MLPLLSRRLSPIGWIAALAIAMGFSSGLALAQTKPAVTALSGAAPASAIFIGNSFFYYNNSLHNHVGRLISAGGGKMSGVSVTISGSGIDWHDVDSYFRPNGIGKYSFDANNNIVFKNPDKLFDIAIVMDCSQCPIHPKLKSVFTEYAKTDAEIIRKHGAQPVFFMSWAYSDHPEMTAQLAEAYTVAGNANHALVIPAGLAFARSLKERPGLIMNVEDRRHPTLAGTYLAACTVYASLLGKSPEGLKYTAGLPEGDAKFLQTIAWQTVKEYYGK